MNIQIKRYTPTIDHNEKTIFESLGYNSIEDMIEDLKINIDDNLLTLTDKQQFFIILDNLIDDYETTYYLIDSINPEQSEIFTEILECIIKNSSDDLYLFLLNISWSKFLDKNNNLNEE